MQFRHDQSMRAVVWTAVVVGSVPFASTKLFGKDGSASQPIACPIDRTHSVSTHRLKVLSKGINISRWFSKLDEPRERPSDHVLKSLRDKGYTYVRLPIAGEVLTSKFGTKDAAKEFLARLDTEVTRLLEFGFGITLDLHPDRGFRDFYKQKPEEALLLLRDIWTTLARRYVDRSADYVFFEILNEPSVKKSLWRDHASKLIRTIREITKDHTLIYGPANFQEIHHLAKSIPFDDGNIVYAAHFYDPFLFTHQGAKWNPRKPWLKYLTGLPFPAKLSDDAIVALLAELEDSKHPDPKNARIAAKELRASLKTDWDESRIRKPFSKLASWAETCRRPVIINEFGVLRPKVSQEHRENWIGAVRAAAQKYNIGLARWELTKGFSLQP